MTTTNNMRKMIKLMEVATGANPYTPAGVQEDDRNQFTGSAEKSEFDTMFSAAIDQGVEYSELNAPGTNLGYGNVGDDWVDLFKTGYTEYADFQRIGKRWTNPESGETADSLWIRVMDRDAWEQEVADDENSDDMRDTPHHEMSFHGRKRRL